jgi:hypothetical protein
MRLKLGARHLVELGRGKCPAGKIRRSGYVRRDGVRVKSACVPDVGAPGKTPAAKRFLPALGPSPLGGWKKDQAASTRLSKLRGVARKKGCRTALRTVNAIANVTTDRETVRRLRADYKRLRADDACKLKTK